MSAKHHPTPDEAAASLGFEIGKTYYCGYWRRNHTIVSARSLGRFGAAEVTSRWDDGIETIHATPFDPKRDRKVSI